MGLLFRKYQIDEGEDGKLYYTHPSGEKWKFIDPPVFGATFKREDDDGVVWYLKIMAQFEDGSYKNTIEVDNAPKATSVTIKIFFLFILTPNFSYSDSILSQGIKKAPMSKDIGAFKKVPAATCSPTRSPTQYHRLWRT